MSNLFHRMTDVFPKNKDTGWKYMNTYFLEWILRPLEKKIMNWRNWIFGWYGLCLHFLVKMVKSLGV